MLGLGMLATGSGAALTSAAFNNSVNASSDMRVVVDKRLEVRAGQAFNDDGTINANNGNINQSNYVEYASNETFFENSSNPDPEELVDIDNNDLPVATVNRRDENINEDVKIQVAVNVDTTNDSVTFTDILEIENNSTDSVKAGISYDRQGGTGSGAGQYGEDVNVDGNTGGEITEQTVQHIYRFIGFGTGTFGSGRISPNQSNKSDHPADVAKIDPGATIPVNLKVDLSLLFGFIDVQSQIESAATLTGGNPFQRKRDMVDLLDAITVGVEDPNNRF